MSRKSPKIHFAGPLTWVRPDGKTRVVILASSRALCVGGMREQDKIEERGAFSFLRSEVTCGKCLSRLREHDRFQILSKTVPSFGGSNTMPNVILFPPHPSQSKRKNPRDEGLFNAMVFGRTMAEIGKTILARAKECERITIEHANEHKKVEHPKDCGAHLDALVAEILETVSWTSTLASNAIEILSALQVPPEMISHCLALHTLRNERSMRELRRSIRTDLEAEEAEEGGEERTS